MECMTANAITILTRAAPVPSNYTSDCVHFCYTPELWRAFFSGMHDTIHALTSATSSGSNLASLSEAVLPQTASNATLP